MNRVALIGGGGFGREVLGYLQQDLKSGKAESIEIIAVIDDNLECETARCNPELAVFSAVRDIPDWKNCQFLIAIGSVRLRRKVAAELLSLDVKPFRYVHSSVLVADDATIGSGCIVAPGTIVNAGAVIGDFCAINVYCSIAHGATIGSCSVLSPYCIVNGDASIGEGCFLGTRSTIYPRVHIGSDCIVDTHAYVKKSIGDRKIVSVRCNYLELDNRLGGHRESSE
jgi:sugar O-acyltransferase (sialic acid O-acetyltransferase NeuD family)